jgi:UDP-2,3-diacylglucosamine pyrophosphatase LpxH
MTPPILVLSDLHLGHPATRLKSAAMLEPLLTYAQTAIFNGDSGELINVERRALVYQRLAELSEVCRRNHVEPVFIAGNHDPVISTAHHWDLFEGKVLVTHGDALHPTIAPWSREAAGLARERRRLLAGAAEPESLAELLLLAKRCALVAARYDAGLPPGWAARVELLSRFVRKPWRAAITLRYWARVNDYCRRLQHRHRPNARLMLIGHTHRAGVWRLGNFTLVNTGGFQPLARPLAVILDERRALVHRVERHSTCFRLGRQVFQLSLEG